MTWVDELIKKKVQRMQRADLVKVEAISVDDLVSGVLEENKELKDKTKFGKRAFQSRAFRQLVSTCKRLVEYSEKKRKSDLKHEDPWKYIILKVLTKMRMPLTTNMIATKTTMAPATAKKKLLELQKEEKVKREGKKWEIILPLLEHPDNGDDRNE